MATTTNEGQGVISGDNQLIAESTSLCSGHKNSYQLTTTYVNERGIWVAETVQCDEDGNPI